ncbi:MAG: HEAT repeat domain-containing protein [Candidatus Heimdallarchaeaceae archaeon]
MMKIAYLTVDDFIIELVNKSLEKSDSSHLTDFIITNKFKTREINKIIRIILKNFSKEDICLLSNLLLKDKNDISKDLVCGLMWVCYTIHKSYVLDVLIKLSDDEDWGIRESAAWLVYYLLKNYYEDFKPFLKKMVESESPNVRRAAAVGIMRFAKHRIPGKGIT